MEVYNNDVMQRIAMLDYAIAETAKIFLDIAERNGRFGTPSNDVYKDYLKQIEPFEKKKAEILECSVPIYIIKNAKVI